MKILLANPPWYEENTPGLWGIRAGSRWPHFQKCPPGASLPRYIPFPFFMAVAASVLRKGGHDVLLIDAVAEGLFIENFHKRVSLFRPDMIFIETSTPSFNYDMELLFSLRKHLPTAVFVCGGCHSPEMAAEYMDEKKFPDFWIAGEYEESFLELADAISAERHFDTIPGVIHSGKKFQRDDGFASVSDLDELPMPLFEHLPMQNYSDPVCGLPSPSAQSWLSRGCPFKCSFCVWPQLIYGGRTYRPRNIDKALDEVEHLIDSYRCESFYFDDDTANIGEDRMRELSDKIRSRGLDKYPWSIMARADCMSDSMLENLAAAGLYSIKYGVESVSPELLDACEKGTKFDKLAKAIEKTKSLGIKLHLTFTFGLPGETYETIMATTRFAIDTAPESAQFSVCTPFPGTKFYDECVSNGWLVTTDWSRFLGSGEDTVIETSFLSAYYLRKGFEEALDAWKDFVDKRLEERKKKLLVSMIERINKGGKWAFKGVSEFGGFIFDSDFKTVFTQSMTDENSADFLVIVSRHDEEKIYRKLKRSSSRLPEILRIFN